MQKIIYLFALISLLTSCSNDDKDVFDYVTFLGGKTGSSIKTGMQFKPDNKCTISTYYSNIPVTEHCTYHKDGSKIWIYSYGNTLEGTGTLEGNTLTYRSGTSVYILERSN